MMIPGLHLPSSRARTMREASNPPGKAPSSRLYPSNHLKRLLEMLSGIPKPHVLDLGRLSSSNIEWLIQRGFKVYADDQITSLKPPPPPPVSLKSEKQKPPPVALEPLDYEPAFFHAVLCWDIFDYLAAIQAQELIAGIARIIKPKGHLLAFFNFNRSSSPLPVRYRILRADQLEYEPLPLNLIPRRIYENREIEELFSGFGPVNFCFLKHQMREVLVQRRSG